jgi:hypothetical protein
MPKNLSDIRMDESVALAADVLAGGGGVFGWTTLSFGASPGQSYTFVDVTGLGGLTAATNLRAFFQGGDTTATNGSDDHVLASSLIQLSCQYLTATSFRIHALNIEGTRAWGDFKVRYHIS